jgi:hypothetical protein
MSACCRVGRLAAVRRPRDYAHPRCGIEADRAVCGSRSRLVLLGESAAGQASSRSDQPPAAETVQRLAVRAESMPVCAAWRRRATA